MSEKASKEEISFEAAFSRLEQILERLNSGEVSLDDSLKLYEEADKLIIACTTRLNQAEKRVEVLMKNRSGELTLDQDSRPTTQEFSPQRT